MRGNGPVAVIGGMRRMWDEDEEDYVLCSTESPYK
jgi:hypothetical protein